MLDWGEGVGRRRGQKALSKVGVVKRGRGQKGAWPKKGGVSRVLSQYINKVQHSFSDQLFTKLCERHQTNIPDLKLSNHVELKIRSS
jgi:hypothetical protein